jgi:hypothetical protein
MLMAEDDDAKEAGEQTPETRAAVYDVPVEVIAVLGRRRFRSAKY